MDRPSGVWLLPATGYYLSEVDDALCTGTTRWQEGLQRFSGRKS